ncbi:MAG: HAMP domain-containing protein, partial [Nitrospiraceae bacterium]
MITKSDLTDYFKKFIKIITFVDLPISKKFFLFSIGVAFWFLVMFIVSIATNISINAKTNKIINHVMPYDRTTQKITRKLQSLSVDASEIMETSDVSFLDRKVDTSKVKISDIRSFINALTHGGEVHDMQRDSKEYIENLIVTPLSEGLDDKYSTSLLPLVDSLDANLDELATLKLAMLTDNEIGNNQLASLNLSVLPDSGSENDQLAEKVRQYKELLSTAISYSNKFSVQAKNLYTVNSQKIRSTAKLNSSIIFTVLFMSTAILIVFTFSISRAFAEPVKSIITQIRELSEGRADFSKNIQVRSKDEIGILTRDFNDLMDEFKEFSTFKKVIEEDDSLEDVYARLGNIFSEKFALEKFTIYEVNNSQNKMKPVYPPMMDNKELYCNEEILSNCNLCKVKKTGHIVSSADYQRICKKFRSDVDKIHVCIPMIIGGVIG